MAAFHAVYYRESDGREPVRAYLDALDDEVHAVLAQQIDRLNLLNDEVPHLPFPHSSQVDGKAARAPVSLRPAALPSPVPPLRPPVRAAAHLLEGHRQDPRRRDQPRPAALAGLHGPDGRPDSKAPTGSGTRRPLTAWVRRTANLAREVSTMAKNDSPIGSSARDHVSERRARSAKYRETQDRLRPFEEIARVVIMRRAQLGLTQQDLAERMGTTKSVISRIESGQHRTSTDTLRRIAEALDGHAVIGFEFDSDQQVRPDLVRL